MGLELHKWIFCGHQHLNVFEMKFSKKQIPSEESKFRAIDVLEKSKLHFCVSMLIDIWDKGQSDLLLFFIQEVFVHLEDTTDIVAMAEENMTKDMWQRAKEKIHSRDQTYDTLKRGQHCSVKYNYL